MRPDKVQVLIATVIASLIMTLICIAVPKFSSSDPSAPAKPAMTPEQKMSNLEKVAGQSPEMQKFIKTEKMNVDAVKETEEAGR